MYPNPRRVRLFLTSSTVIKAPDGCLCGLPGAPRSCHCLMLIAAASSSPSAQRPGRTEDKQRPSCPRIHTRALLQHSDFTELSRRTDAAFPLQTLSSLYPFFFPFLRKPKYHFQKVEENKANEGQPFKQLFNESRAHLRVTISAQFVLGEETGK